MVNFQHINNFVDSKFIELSNEMNLVVKKNPRKFQHDVIGISNNLSQLSNVCNFFIITIFSIVYLIICLIYQK